MSLFCPVGQPHTFKDWLLSGRTRLTEPFYRRLCSLNCIGTTQTALLLATYLCTATHVQPALANQGYSIPSTPANISVQYYSATAAELTWLPSSDPDGIALYRVYVNGALLRVVEGPSFFTDTLSPGTNYSLQISSVDATGQESVWSPVINVRTNQTIVEPATSGAEPLLISDSLSEAASGDTTIIPNSIEDDLQTIKITGDNTTEIRKLTQPKIVNPQIADPDFISPTLQPAPATLQKVPGLLDNLYKYNVNGISDLITYRRPDGQLVQLLTYWADDRRLHITERNFPGGEFLTPVDIHTAVMGGQEALEYDSHNSAAIGVASNGVMFVTGNHHVSELNMAKSATPYDIGSLTRMAPSAMVSLSEVERVTYPSFFNHGGYLYFSYREQEAGQNAPRFRWMINRYDPGRDEWTTAVQFNTGIKLRLYVSNIAVEPDGDTMHMFGIWRNDAGKGSNHVDNQQELFHLYSNNGTDWFPTGSSRSVTADKPLWFNNGERGLSGYTGQQLNDNEKIWSKDKDPKPRNAGAITVDNTGFAQGLVKAEDGALYHHAWTGAEWRSDRLQGWSSHGYDIVSCPNDTAAILSVNEKVYYRSLNPSKKTHTKPVLLADGFTTKHFTLSVDKEAIKYGYISLMLTSNSHYSPGTHSGQSSTNKQPAWVATVHCDSIESQTAFKR